MSDNQNLRQRRLAERPQEACIQRIALGKITREPKSPAFS
jgi:hypothetical protein